MHATFKVEALEPDPHGDYIRLTLVADPTTPLRAGSILMTVKPNAHDPIKRGDRFALSLEKLP